MMIVLSLLAVLAGLVTFVCSIIILIAAFKEDLGTGVFCLICGPYLLYWALAKFRHEKRGQILAAWIGSAVASVAFNMIASFVGMSAARGSMPM